jgi:hypothetical protein
MTLKERVLSARTSPERLLMKVHQLPALPEGEGMNPSVLREIQEVRPSIHDSTGPACCLPSFLKAPAYSLSAFFTCLPVGTGGSQAGEEEVGGEEGMPEEAISHLLR